MPDWNNDAKKFIDAAQKYAIADLKVEAEAWHVTYFTLAVDNAIEALLYAGDGLSSLRDAAMNFILNNAKEVITSDSFENGNMTKAITNEILVAIFTAGDDNTDTDEKGGEILSINYLRRVLYEKGLDIDGSREMLVSRLNE